MRKSELNRFKKLFESRLKEFAQNGKTPREDFALNDDDKFDEVDQATADVEATVQMRLHNREVLNFKQLQSALSRIEEGNYGECHSCGEDIEIRRLEVRPTATLCVSCQEENEHADRLSAAI